MMLQLRVHPSFLSLFVLALALAFAPPARAQSDEDPPGDDAAEPEAGSDAEGSDDASDADGSDTDGSDTDGSDTDGSDTDGSDTDGSDAAGSDAAGSDAAGSEATGSDADSSETESSDTDETSAEGSDTSTTGPSAEGETPEGAASDETIPEESEEASPPLPAVTEEEAAPEPTEEPAAESWHFYVRAGGDYRFRFNMMSDIPLNPLPRTDPAETGDLGQNYYGEQWLRLRGEIGFRPQLRLKGQMDILRGVAFGDLAQGTGPAGWARDDYGYPGLRLRFLYLEWLTEIGLFRIGQMGFSWGLGMLANDGDTEATTVFGDYRYGDLVRRIFFAARPAGNDVPWVVALAADWVAWDLLADFERGDLAFQGVLGTYYGEPNQRVGGYGAYRRQWNALNDELEVGVLDIYARYGFQDDDGGELFAAFEGAYIRGTTSFARTTEHETQVVEQLLGVLQVGRKHPTFDVVLETGYTSGDSNTEDALQGRGTMDPDHRVGLIMFPEVMAAQTARSAYLAQSPELSGRPSRGVELLPTNGGVAGAFYLFPYAIWRPWDWIEGRVGGVFGYATADVVDPFRLRALSQYANFQGGAATGRDLGFEVDASVLVHGEVEEGLILSGGIEGGLFFPGSAFNDQDGNGMGLVGLLRARVGLRYMSPDGP